MRALVARSGLAIAAVLSFLSSPALAQAPAPLDPQTVTRGNAIYAATCAACHDNALTHAPGRAAIAGLAAESVLRVLTSGRMKQQAADLGPGDKAAVAQAVTGKPLGSAPAEGAMPRCTGDAARFDVSEPPRFDGWGLDRNNSHAIPTAQAGLTAANIARLKLKWAFGFPQTLDARSQPAVAGGAIYVGGGDGTLYALDRATGCLRWSYTATSAVRSGVVVSPWPAGDTDAAPLLYFGDSFGNAYALDARTGAEAWVVRIDDHRDTVLTGTPTLFGDTLYVPVSSFEEGSAVVPGYACCTFRGALLALDARTGETRWRTFLVGEPAPLGTTAAGSTRYGPSGVAVWSAPLVDAGRGLVYVATGDNYTQPATELSDALVALDMRTGAIRWASQVTAGDSWNVACFAGPAAPNCPADAGPDADFGAAPVLAKGADGKDYLLAGQKSGVAYALDPDSGKVLWQTRVGRGGEVGGVHFGIAAEGGRLYVPIHDPASLGATAAEPGRPGIHALDVATGRAVWSTVAENACGGAPLCQPGYSAAITVTPELVLAGSVDAHLRIFDARTGAVLWDEDTNRAYPTVNGVTAHGGSMSGGSAPLALDGTMIFNSGYAFLGKLPGNVLLVYTIE
jgi:polyvinyl alcohol dehydrogenase (cytochrome)